MSGYHVCRRPAAKEGWRKGEARGNTRKHTENNTGKRTILGEREDARPSREGKQGQQKQRKRPGLPPWGLGPAGMYFYPTVPVHSPMDPALWLNPVPHGSFL